MQYKVGPNVPTNRLPLCADIVAGLVSGALTIDSARDAISDTGLVIRPTPQGVTIYYRDFATGDYGGAMDASRRDWSNVDDCLDELMRFL